MPRLLLAVLATATLLLPVAKAEAAAPRLPAPARDCLADGRIDHHYTKPALRRAIGRLTPGVKHGATCKQRLRRVLRHGGDGRVNGRGGVRAVMRDCADNGWLDRRWTPALLRSTARRLPTDLEEYSDCAQVLRKELRARRSRA